MKRLLIVAASVAVFAAAGASGAYAGEVKGPPGTPCGGEGQPACEESTNYTGARENSNSICSFSGLNDMDPNLGQTSSIVQTPGKDSPAPGTTGHGTCAGGSNPERTRNQ